ncbi:MAG: tRNA (adenosine(37)-N6)-threonylcarbamoyltransferase complex dimerization subunit type 1 TsaB [Patescibacteria group bacterium]|nr:tRNA (adenosine(37)-N6)-threonylcarbamoyltransferase complex dimerization subunit type 1 TsaB [Patescibacteria group bacterium]
MYLTIRTDKPEAELGLFDGTEKIAYHTWEAHRQLAETIHHTIAALLDTSGLQMTDLKGIVVFSGPGSFTGLRIGVSVANAFADGLQIPIVGTQNEGWIAAGTNKLTNGDNDRIVLPEYGAEARTTQQRK